MFRGWESALRKAKNRRGESKHRPWPLSQRPGFLIRRLHQIHVALFQEACGEFEITPLQYSLLSALAARETADQGFAVRDDVATPDVQSLATMTDEEFDVRYAGTPFTRPGPRGMRRNAAAVPLA